jgi:hypothetical protein
MLFVDAGANHVNIGTGSDLGGMLNVAGPAVVSYNSGDIASLTIQDTGTSQAGLNIKAGSGSTNRASRVNFFNNVTSTSTPRWAILNDYFQNGDNDFVIADSAATFFMHLTSNHSDGGAFIINDQSDNVDFRVESDSNANMLFVDAGQNRVGVGTNSPATAFNVVGHTRITGPIDSDDASTGYAASGAYATISGLPCYEGVIYQYVARSNLSPTNVAMAMGYAMGRGGTTFTFSNVLTTGRITMSSGANGDITITNSHSGSATCAFRVLRVV